MCFEFGEEFLVDARDCVLVVVFCVDVEVVAVFVYVLGVVGLDGVIVDCLCEDETVFFECCVGEFVVDFEGFTSR